MQQIDFQCKWKINLNWIQVHFPVHLLCYDLSQNESDGRYVHIFN